MIIKELETLTKTNELHY